MHSKCTVNNIGDIDLCPYTHILYDEHYLRIFMKIIICFRDTSGQEKFIYLYDKRRTIFSRDKPKYVNIHFCNLI